jgi:hypothetical protein
LFQGFVNDVFSDLGGTATGRVTIKANGLPTSTAKSTSTNFGWMY